MVVIRPFYNAEHMAAFERAREHTQIGGPSTPACGAKTRSGGVCRQLPLAGRRRCIRHAGPKAAREFRVSQRQDMERGKISFEQFDAAERRRAANRLHDNWKKDAWQPGGTIELGEYEAAFVDDVRHWAGSLEEMPPAILDWLRWRYRRLQVDRSQAEKWIEVLQSELQQRVRDAGPRPQRPITSENLGNIQTWHAKGWTYKRSKADVVPDTPVQGLSLPKLTNACVATPKRIADIVKGSSAVLKPLLAMCATEDERDTLVATLVDYVDRPWDGSARRRWSEAVRALGAR